MTALTPLEGRKALNRILASSLECSNRLEALLCDERAALRSQNADDLQSIVAGKLDCVQTLDRFEKDRRDLAVELGFGPDESGMQALIGWCESSPKLDAAWRELLATAGRCRDLNEGNGAISRVRQEHLKNAVAVLRGVNGENAIYDAQGQDRGDLSRREIARV